MKYFSNHNLLLAILFGAIGFTPMVAEEARAGSPKRGWAGSDVNEINAANASWSYNWWHTKPSWTPNSNAEWIPLIKFINGNTQNNLNTIAGYSDVDTLLVLNEPERPDQTNATVAEAIGMWPMVEATLPNHKLVSPAVSDTADGRDWLTDFMSQANAQNLRVDAVAFHWYGASTPNNPAGAATTFLNRVQFYHDTFNLPVWITEFAIHDWGSNYSDEAIKQANAEFLDIVLPELESRSYVERYAFYDQFPAPNEDANIFTQNPITPTVVGDAYIGTLYSGDTFDLAGFSQGTDVFYVRGGQITNADVAVPTAMRAIDAIDGASSLSGSGDWGLAGSGAMVTIRAAATLRKTGANTVTFANAPIVNNGHLEVADGTLSIQNGQLSGTGSVHVGSGATLQLRASGGRDPYAFPALRSTSKAS